MINLSTLCTAQCFGDYKFEKMADLGSDAARRFVHETLEECRVGHLILNTGRNEGY